MFVVWKWKESEFERLDHWLRPHGRIQFASGGIKRWVNEFRACCNDFEKKCYLDFTGRCLHFFTTVVTPFVERFRLDGMKDIPTSLAYMAPAVTGRSEPLLGVGDDEGDVFVLRFLKASTSLFKKREADGEIQHIYWRVGRNIINIKTVWHHFVFCYLPFQLIFIGIAPAGRNGDAYNYARMPRQSRTAGWFKKDHVEGSFVQQELHHIVSHTSLVSPIRRNEHTAVRHSPYKPGKSEVLKKRQSCYKWRKKISYVCGVHAFNIYYQGVTCFDYDDEKGLIVSGSTDGNIRLWSPTHLAKPWMVLSGHAATISAVCLVKQSEFLWSLSDQAVRSISY